VLELLTNLTVTVVVPYLDNGRFNATFAKYKSAFSTVLLLLDNTKCSSLIVALKLKERNS
jgi:hypothetical protein